MLRGTTRMVQKCPIGHFCEGIKVPCGTLVTHYRLNCASLVRCKSALLGTLVKESKFPVPFQYFFSPQLKLEFSFNGG